LGSFSVAFSFKWHISSDYLAALDWSVLTTDPEWYNPYPEDKLYINVLKFLATSVNTWLSIKILLTRDTPAGGWIIKFLSDNTSTLGWMANASCMRRPTIQNIDRAYATMLIFLALSIFTVTMEHVPSVENNDADTLCHPS